MYVTMKMSDVSAEQASCACVIKLLQHLHAIRSRHPLCAYSLPRTNNDLDVSPSGRFPATKCGRGCCQYNPKNRTKHTIFIYSAKQGQEGGVGATLLRRGRRRGSVRSRGSVMRRGARMSGLGRRGHRCLRQRAVMRWVSMASIVFSAWVCIVA